MEKGSLLNTSLQKTAPEALQKNGREPVQEPVQESLQVPVPQKPLYNKVRFSLRAKNLAAAGLLVLGTAFIVFGIMRGEQRVVLQKAIRVCLECIGIG